MKIEYQHNLTDKEVYNRISKFLLDLQKKYADQIRNPKASWNPEHTRMKYSMEIMGFGINGEIVLRKSQISLEGKIPFMAKMFSGKIEETVRKQLEELLS